MTVHCTALLLLAACLQVSARTQAQITLTEKKAPLEKVLQEIKAQSGYDLVYQLDLLREKGKPVDVRVTNVTLQSALEAVFRDQELRYEIVGKIISIKEKPEVIKTSSDVPVSPPTNEIHGRVTDSLGNPLAGASVTVKGKRQGTTTDDKGYFTLKGANSGVLTISFTGYAPKEVAVQPGQEVVTSLRRSTSPLDEVKVIAYGTTTGRLELGDVTTVKAEEIERQPVANPLLALEARVPGVFITQTNGLPGSGVTVQIQGQNSIAYGNDPFYVIDGIPYNSQMLPSISGVLGVSNSGGPNTQEGNPLNYINPQDIESISILKGADATAIYGSRAANGAIIITTKKGKAGKNTGTIDFQQGAGHLLKEIHLLNTQQYLQVRHEALNNDGTTPSLANGDYDLLLWDTTRYTDWQKVLIGGTSQVSNLNGSLSGGTPNVQYLVSGVFRREGTVMPGNFNDTKAGLHVNLNTASENQRFHTQLSASYMYDDNKLPNVDLTYLSVQLAPDAPPLYNKDGSINWAENAQGASTWPFTTNYLNPLAYTLVTYQNQTKNLISSLALSYRILPGLEIRANGGYTDMQTGETIATPLSSQLPQTRPYSVSYGTYGNNDANSWILEPQLNYKGMAGGGKLDLLVGATIEQNNSKSIQFMGLGYTSDALIDDPSAAAQLFPGATTLSIYKYAALFSRIGYNWQDKYLINLNGRRDGSSRFGMNNQFHDFGSVGAGWIFSNESFIKDHPGLISFGKLRTSYGTTGNDQIGNYQYLSTYTTAYASLPYQGVAGLVPAGLANPYLQWEATKKLEFGLDLGLLKDRILLNADYYRNLSSNELLSYNLPITTGFGGINENFPATVENTGWEFSLHTVNIKTKHFSWSSSLNLTIARNRLTAFPNLASSGYANSLRIGKPINIVIVPHSIGVNDTTGMYEFFADSKGDLTYNPLYPQGLTRVIDLTPKYHGGFENTVTYKGLTLDFLFEFVKQSGFNYVIGYHPGWEGVNQPVSVLNRWQRPGDQKPIELYSAGFGEASTAFNAESSSDANFGDISFIRLKNLSLTWNLPKSLLHKTGLQNGKLFADGQNLMTFDHFSGFDPSSQSLGSVPPLRVINFGIQVSL